MDILLSILGIGFTILFIVSLYDKYKLKTERKHGNFFNIAYFILGIICLIGAFSPY